MADFDSHGKMPVLNFIHKMSAIAGARQGSIWRRRAVGIGSRRQAALEDFVIKVRISEGVVGRKCSNYDVGGLSSRS